MQAVQSADDLEEFLGLLYGDVDGFVYVAVRNQTLPKTHEDYWQPQFFQWPQDKDLIGAFLKKASIDYDTYIAPALFSAPDAKKQYVKGSNVAWVDFDGKLPTTLHDVPGPSLVIESSDPLNKKQHWYWRLENFVTDIRQIERLNRGLAYLLDADISGWDANQVLRPPTTRNHKYGNPQPVSLLSASPHTINPSAFGGLPEPPSIPVEFNVSDLLDQALIVASYQWTTQAFNLYRSTQEQVRVSHKEGRSGALMQLAYFGAEMGMNDAEIFTLLFNADTRWDKFVGRPDRVRRLNDIIAKARIKHPYKLVQVKDLEVLGLKDFLSKEVIVEWVVPDFLEASGQLLLSAKPGIGKSRFSLRFFIALALGKNFLHYTVSKPRKVVYFSLEMGHAQLLYFLGKMVQSLEPGDLDVLQENLKLVPLGEALYLDKRAGQNLVEKVLTDHNPDGYAFDSLSRLTPETVNDEASVKLILDWDAATRNSQKTFSWFIHHNRKASVGNKKPKKLDDILGATVIAANTTAAYTLWSDDIRNKTIDVICVKQRMAEMEKPYLIVSDNDLGFSERAILNTESFEVPGDSRPTRTTLPSSESLTFDEKKPPEGSGYTPNLGF